MNIKKALMTGALAASILAMALPAFAGKPTNPGCFGSDRAAYIHNIALTDSTEPGASEVGIILSGRAGDNGAINQAYKTGCGGDPTP